MFSFKKFGFFSSFRFSFNRGNFCSGFFFLPKNILYRRIIIQFIQNVFFFITGLHLNFNNIHPKLRIVANFLSTYIIKLFRKLYCKKKCTSVNRRRNQPDRLTYYLYLCDMSGNFDLHMYNFH